MHTESDDGETHVIEVEFNQQQDVVLRRLRESGEFGTEDGEIIRNVFREFLRPARTQ